MKRPWTIARVKGVLRRTETRFGYWELAALRDWINDRLIVLRFRAGTYSPAEVAQYVGVSEPRVLAVLRDRLRAC